MAEYTEVIKQFKRMCKSITPIECTRGECPMGLENIGQCRKVAFECPEKFEEQVMAWAAKHPEPKYPSWEEYLCSIGFCSYNSLSKPIPADIAQKLGIEPKG